MGFALVFNLGPIYIAKMVVIINKHDKNIITFFFIAVPLKSYRTPNIPQ
jgi:hypothetical protein